MNTPQGKPKASTLTDPQKYKLGEAVQRAYERSNWDGKLNSNRRPILTGASEPTANALIRQGMIEEVKNDGYRTKLRLTQAGVEAGTESCIQRLGEHPREHAAKERAVKEKAEREAQEVIKRIANLFTGFKVKRGKKKVSLPKLIEEELNVNYRSTVSLSCEQVKEIGEQVQNLVP